MAGVYPDSMIACDDDTVSALYPDGVIFDGVCGNECDAQAFQQCDNCKFGKELTLTMSGKTVTRCRYYPPRTHAEFGQVDLQPLMACDDWCGQWAPRKGVSFAYTEIRY